MPLTKVQSAMTDTLVSGTAVTASGTSVDFTSIPSWVKRITVMFSGVSTNGTSLVLIQIGSGSVTTSGYVSSCSTNGGTSSSQTAGFIVNGRGDAANTIRGAVILTTLGSNLWVSNGATNSINSDVWSSGGTGSLSGTLDRVRITTVNGTDTFDAGTINILYE